METFIMTNTELSGGDADLLVQSLRAKVAALEAEKAGRQQAVPSVCPRCLGKGSYPGVYGKHACNCSAPAERVEHAPVAEVIPNVVVIEMAWIDPWNKPPVGTKLYTTHQPVERAEPVAILCREIGETSWFDHNPLVPGSPTHIARSNSPEWDTCPVFSPAPAAPDVNGLIDSLAEALKLAASRIDRLGLNQPVDSGLYHEAKDWANEAWSALATFHREG
jgi:hypothetical protein